MWNRELIRRVPVALFLHGTASLRNASGWARCSAAKALERTAPARAYATGRESVEGAGADPDDESFAVATHRIRGALTSVVGYSARLQAAVRAGRFSADEEHAEEIQQLAQAADRLRDAIEGLFTLEELSRGVLEVEVDPLHLARVVEGEVKRARERHEGLSVSLACDDEAVVESDARHVRRILRTLLENAVAHAGPAGPSVDVALDATADGGATITVRDGGPGVPEELRDTVFAREYVKDGEVRYRTGFGLYLASRLADCLGGRLTLEPAGSGGGAAFTLALPAVGPEA